MLYLDKNLCFDWLVLVVGLDGEWFGIMVMV